MGSGEGDVAHLRINTSNNTLGNFNNLNDYYTAPYTGTTTWTYTTYKYKYQVRCPKAGCKKFNWLELDMITPCHNCGAKLKAVTEQPDFTVPVHE